MTILAIELSSSVGSLAIAEEGNILAFKKITGQFQYDEKFVPTLKALLKKAGIKKEEVTCIGIDAGPGSFTGIRLALSAAKGFAFDRDVSIYDFNTMDILLFQAYRELRDEYIVPVICIKKNSYFAGVYKRNNEGGFRCIKKPTMLTTAEIKALEGKQYTLYGYGLETEFKTKENYPLADALALMTSRDFSANRKPPADIEPVYVWDFVPSLKRQYIK